MVLAGNIVIIIYLYVKYILYICCEINIRNYIVKKNIEGYFKLFSRYVYWFYLFIGNKKI